jgi:catechol 2,3-dioxygenase-like lactoylglutathione lyase family enzyme
MQLAKPRIDVGLFTNNLEPMLAFWQQDVGLAFDHMQPLGGGKRQHRHALLGSVLKINHAREPLPESPPSGYRELLIAQEGLAQPKSLEDPDGNRVTLVPPGLHGIERIGVRLAVRDLAAQRQFYSHVLQLPAGAVADSFTCGDSVLLLEEDATAPEDAAYEAAGFRYITIQVRHVNAEHAGVLARGGREGRAPVTLGETARISFVRDPDGNWIELSQRASLTGSLA